MADQLQFDLAKMREFSHQLESLSNELSNTASQLTKDLEELKKDWDTPSGRKFFSEQTVEWQDQVKKYKELIRVLKEMIDESITEYEDIEAETKRLINS